MPMVGDCPPSQAGGEDLSLVPSPALFSWSTLALLAYYCCGRMAGGRKEVDPTVPLRSLLRVMSVSFFLLAVLAAIPSIPSRGCVDTVRGGRKHGTAALIVLQAVEGRGRKT